MAFQTQEQRIAALERRINQLARIIENQNRRLAALSAAPQPQTHPAYPTQRFSAAPPASTHPVRPSRTDFDRDPEAATFEAVVQRQRALNGR